MICETCNQEMDDYGLCECRPLGTGTDTAELLGFFVFIGLVFLALFVKFYSIPSMQRQECFELVRTEEASFLRAFQTQANNNPNLSILGWECELVHPWGLVTYLYRDSPDTNERKAYFWCVNLEQRTVNRLRSLTQFVDDYLLKEAPPPPP